MKRAALYARISLDRTQEGAGVGRQLDDCRAEAERRGWEVVGEYQDNDMSAYSGKPRPEYDRMLADIESGHVNAVIVYHLDRLTRRPVELEDFLTVCDRAGIKDLVTIHGDVNIGTGDGLLIARIMAAVAANESASKSRRVTRKARARAEAGKPHRTSVRPFGYEDDHVTIREPEADIIRTLVDRFLAGESLNGLTTWLNETGIKTSTGKDRWHVNTVRQMIRSGRIAGLREYHGEVIGDAEWPAIITRAKHDRVRRILDDPARRLNRGTRRYLLAGMLRCGRCDHPLFSSRRNDRHRYICKSATSIGGCGGIFVTGEPLDEFVTEAVLQRLDSPALADALAGRQEQTADSRELAEQIASDEAQLEDLASMWAGNEITVKEWKAARTPIEQRINTARRRLAQLTATGPLAAIAGQGESLRDTWENLTLDRQRAIVAAVLDHVIVNPATRRSTHTLDIDRVQAVWKL